MYKLSQIAQISHSKFLGKTDYAVNTFLSDSRNLFSPDGVLFVAIKTGKDNGHKYLLELVEKGVTSFLIQEEEIQTEVIQVIRKEHSDVSFIISTDTLKALQELATYHRSQFNIPVIGITGSNGKTVVKEWLYQLLKNNYSICRSPKSYNSQLGVPLSVLNLNHTHTLAVFEAGISKPGEMEILAKIIQPTIGIVTSIGSAHDEGFQNREQKISEKLKLVENCRNIILNGIKKHQVADSLLHKSTFVSEFEDADLQILFSNNLLQLIGHANKHEFKIPFTDDASVLNISTCIVTLLQLGYSTVQISERMDLLQPIALRLEIKNGINNCLVINDFYNSDLDSLKIALNYLQHQSRRNKKAVIVSDIEQSGVLDNNLYRQIADLTAGYKIDLIVGIGKKISAFKYLFKSDSLFFESTEHFVRQFDQFSFRFSDSTILLKGARSFGFESISSLLQQKSHDTVFEINLNKLIANVNYFKLLTKSNVRLMCMVKAMGYGGGSSELANTLQHIGVNYLAVAYIDEGVELRQSHIKLPIMVMSPEIDGFEDMINHHLEPEIYSFRVLSEFVAKLDQLCVSGPYPVHIKIDTGMHRLGFEENDISELIAVLKDNPQIKVQSVFSHLAASDNPALDDFSEQQIKLFQNICDKIENGISAEFLKHICNSAAISRFKHAHFDMVRLGIGMHGVGVNADEQKHLENVGTLKTKISQIRPVKAGETVSYNRSGRAGKDIVIATIPIGYADGFSRALGNGHAGVFINGNYCKTIGNVCMDMCMVDITGIKCAEGNEVIIFENADQLHAIANAMNTISYEVLTSVSGRVKRIYVQE